MNKSHSLKRPALSASSLQMAAACTPSKPQVLQGLGICYYSLHTKTRGQDDSVAMKTEKMFELVCMKRASAEGRHRAGNSSHRIEGFSCWWFLIYAAGCSLGVNRGVYFRGTLLTEAPRGA